MIQMSVLGLRRMGTDVYSIINQKTASMKSAADKVRRTDMNKDWNSSTSDYGGKPMDVKRYRLSDLMTMAQFGYEEYVLYDDIKHLLTRPDPAEVERLVDEYVELIVDNTPVFTSDSRYIIKNILQQYRAELLKLAGG